MVDLKNISQEVVNILPQDFGDFAKQVESTGWIEPYMDSLGLRVQNIFKENNVDIAGDNLDVIEFRHFMKNTVLRVEEALRKPKESYFWIDIFRRNIQNFFIDSTLIIK